MAGVGIYVTGPVFWSVGTAAGTPPVLTYLGVCEGETQINLNLAEEDVRTDLSGPAIPQDVQMMGEQATISGTLLRLDDAQFGKLLSRFANPNGISGGGTAGTLPAGGLGSLMVTEQNSVELNLYFPYNTKAIFSGSNPSTMIASMDFKLAWMAGGVNIGAGTRARRQQVVMRAIPKFTITSAGAAYVLWDQTKPASGVLSTFN